MKAFSSWTLLAALGVLSPYAAAAADAAVDTSEWKCTSCPFDKTGVSGAVDVGAGVVSDRSAKFGDYNGLDRKGAHLVVGGNARYTGNDGLYGRVDASDLGLDSRTLAGEFGREGLFSLRLGYAEIAHRVADDAQSPFTGVGSTNLGLPAGFPAATTGAMPLATTLQPVDLGTKRSRFDLGGAWLVGENWSHRLSIRHEEREGTQRIAGSFFSTSSQLVAPVNQGTDQFAVSTAFSSRKLQASLGYQISLFHNDHDALTWANPFTPVVAGAGSGQLALAPDNQMHQIVGSGGYEILPWLRASGDFAVGRMTQDQSFLASTLNTSLGAGNPAALALPSASLNGRVDTYNGSVRLAATPMSGLRVNASYVHDQRDNRTASQAYPAVSTDMFYSPVARSNQPFGFKQDKWKLSADYRGGPGALKTSVGVEQDNRERSLQEVVMTHETTVWGRVAAQPRDNVSLSLKVAHAQRNPSTYGVATWVDPAENPLLRKFNLADRTRDSVGVRADVTVGERLTLGVNADTAHDAYTKSAIGLTDGQTASLGGDVSFALSDETQLRLFAQAENMRSKQLGSQVAAAADWNGRNDDKIQMLGLGATQTALKGALELTADLVFARTRSEVSVDAGGSDPAFPAATTALDSLKVRAVYRLQKDLSLIGSFWHEHYESKDWRADGVLPATVPNLLALGMQPPQYRVNVLQLALRYRF